MLTSNQITLSIAFIALSCATAQADLSRGVHQFGSEQHCAATGKLPSEVCATAAVNAAAEFEEKAPRFSSREACEHVFHGGCAIGFRGAMGYAGRRSGVYFTPRQTGFRVTVKSDHDARVTPLGPGNFSSRNALTRDASINPHGSREYRPPQFYHGSNMAGAAFGVPMAEGAKGPLPPPPPVDPNFDCSSVLEPGSDPSTGCVLAPVRRR